MTCVNLRFNIRVVAEKLKQAIVEYSEEWIIDSILEAVQHGVRKWIYIEATLKSWKSEDGKLKERILVIDGAMGTEIQSKKLSESDFRGELF